MHIREIPPNSQVTVIASIDKHYLEFNTRVMGASEENIIMELIKNDEGKAISFASDKITVDISFVEEEEKPPFMWRNVKVTHIKHGNNMYHMATQSSEGKRENRRGAYRLFLGEDATLDIVDNPRSIPVILKDISSTGFAFIHPGELSINKFCKISCNIDNKKLVLSGVIVRKQIMDNGNTVYGCHMEKFSKELEKFIAQKQRELINNKFK